MPSADLRSDQTSRRSARRRPRAPWTAVVNPRYGTSAVAIPPGAAAIAASSATIPPGAAAPAASRRAVADPRRGSRRARRPPPWPGSRGAVSDRSGLPRPDRLLRHVAVEHAIRPHDDDRVPVVARRRFGRDGQPRPRRPAADRRRSRPDPAARRRRPDDGDPPDPARASSPRQPQHVRDRPARRAAPARPAGRRACRRGSILRGGRARGLSHAVRLCYRRGRPPSSWRWAARSGIRVRRASTPGATVRRLARCPPLGRDRGLGDRRPRLRVRQVAAAAQSDLSTLLPHSQRSVQDLEALKRRARPFGTIHVVVEAGDPRRGPGPAALRERLARLPPEDVVSFSPDDGPIYRYGWEHRFLLAKLPDPEAARDALRTRIERAKLKKNPLFIDLDDEPPAPAAGKDQERDRFTELEQKLADLEQKAQRPPPRASARTASSSCSWSRPRSRPASTGGPARCSAGSSARWTRSGAGARRRSGSPATRPPRPRARLRPRGDGALDPGDDRPLRRRAVAVLPLGPARARDAVGARRRRGGDVRARLRADRPPRHDERVPGRDRDRQRHQPGADPRRALPRGGPGGRAPTEAVAPAISAPCPARSPPPRPPAPRTSRCSSPTSSASATSARSRASAWR